MNQLAGEIEAHGAPTKEVQVQVSYEVVKLLSEQLYATPVKAIEELVVNSWDAEATNCSVFVELDGPHPLIAVFDDGKGMTLRELENLWHIGVSNKAEVASTRKQIGKFGIGNLASNAVARQATYVSRTAEGIHAVSMDFERFAAATDRTGTAEPVGLTLRRVDGTAILSQQKGFQFASNVLQMGDVRQDLEKTPTWTLVVLENLKETAHQLSIGRMRWVLETAMPLESDFRLYLNGERVASSKERYERLVHFTIDELEDDRIRDLSLVTNESWTRIEGGLRSRSFPSGVTGEVYVTRRSLYAQGGKSEDLGRSHGFFVRVHNRLINENDPLLGARPLSFGTWYRFAAIVEASDLHKHVTASRDDVKHSEAKGKLRELLIQLFNQARDGRTALLKKREDANRRRREGARDYVSTELVERPIADALVVDAASPDRHPEESRAKHGWKLLEPVTDIAELQGLVEQLYMAERSSRRYTFKYSASGPLSPVARLDPRTATFVVNEDHQLVREFADKAEGRRLLESLIVAETLLEVYLRAADIDTAIVVDLLDRRDSLLRSLAMDESYSLHALAASLREAKNNASDLEVALVGALRALGFGARHIGGSGTPDGLATYIIHGVEGKSFTLEAKSSGDVPSLGHLDFAGLSSHYHAIEADGCLLVAPSYPGGDSTVSEVSRRARELQVSCWTIEQLAQVVEAAERRHITAPRVQTIVLNSYGPADVSLQVNGMLAEPGFDHMDLYRAVIAALVNLEPRLRGTPRNVYLLAAEISRDPDFRAVDTPDIQRALADLARASSGMLHVTDENEVFVLGSLDELRRRTAGLTGDPAPPRRLGTFRARSAGDLQVDG